MYLGEIYIVRLPKCQQHFVFFILQANQNGNLKKKVKPYLNSTIFSLGEENRTIKELKVLYLDIKKAYDSVEQI